MSDVAQLEPKTLWKHFAGLCTVPRPSKKEEQVRAWLKETVKALGYTAEQDATGNLLVRKPGSVGHENAPTLVLQGHMDMVCEKNKETQHDFDRDPIQAYVDGDWVRARGTTLGADNGIGIAAALALLEAKDVVHPPLEILITTDEETGLTGAKGLKPGFLRGERLLNLDSEEDGVVYVGCAGGGDTVGRMKLERVDAPAGQVALQLTIGGLKGGHSGTDIDKGRGNAIVVLARLLRHLASVTELRLATVAGGSKRNAIPREAEALCLVPTADVQKVKNAVAEFQAQMKPELGSADLGLVVAAKEAEAPGKVIAPAQAARIVDALQAMPHGVLRMSPDIANLVETSTNLATVNVEGDELVVGTSQRSLVASAKQATIDQVCAAMRLAGFEPKVGEGYPGWKPNLASKVLAEFKAAWKELHGEEPKVLAIHAGLECGLIGETFPKMDMISIGPTIVDAHSPDERLNIAASQRFWTALVKLLGQLAKG